MLSATGADSLLLPASTGHIKWGADKELVTGPWVCYNLPSLMWSLWEPLYQMGIARAHHSPSISPLPTLSTPCARSAVRACLPRTPHVGVISNRVITGGSASPFSFKETMQWERTFQAACQHWPDPCQFVAAINKYQPWRSGVTLALHHYA